MCSDTQFACLWCTRTEIDPLQVCPVSGVDPLNLLVKGVFTLESFVLGISLEKWEYILCLLLSRIGHAQIHNR